MVTTSPALLTKMSIYGIIYKNKGVENMKKNDTYYDSRHVDEAGRIVIPKPMRDRIGIVSDKTPLEIYSESDKIVIKVHTPGCVICGNIENTVELKGKRVCFDCIEKLNKIREINS